MDYRVIPLPADRLEEAMALVKRVFDRFEAPEYAPEGVAQFHAYIEPDAIRALADRGELLLWACMVGEDLAGVGAMRPPDHVSLLFVEERYHRQGIARSLVNEMAEWTRSHGAAALTVNASPYGVSAYRRMGFRDDGPETCRDGMRFTPMTWTF